MITGEDLLMINEIFTWDIKISNHPYKNFISHLRDKIRNELVKVNFTIKKPK